MFADTLKTSYDIPALRVPVGVPTHGLLSSVAVPMFAVPSSGERSQGRV